MPPILLSDWIEAIRQDLQIGVVRARERPQEANPLAFELDEVTIEVEVVTETSAEASGKVKFWVLETGGKVGRQHAETQKLTIKLRAAHADPQLRAPGAKTPHLGPEHEEDLFSERAR
jgi:hypothetical protein